MQPRHSMLVGWKQDATKLLPDVGPLEDSDLSGGLGLKIPNIDKSCKLSEILF